MDLLATAPAPPDAGAPPGRTRRRALTTALALLATLLLSSTGAAGLPTPEARSGSPAPTPCPTSATGCVVTTITSSPRNAAADGTLDTQSSVGVTLELAVPDDARPGDEIRLEVTDPIFVVQPFTDVALADDDGTVVALASGNGAGMTLTLTDAVTRLDRATAGLTFFVRPSLAPTHREAHTLDLSHGGAIVGPGDTYTIAAWGPTATQIDAGPATIAAGELGLVTSTYFRVPGGDVRTARAEITAVTPGAYPVCTGDAAPYLLWVTNDDGPPRSLPGVNGELEQRVHVERCDPATGTVVLAVPPDLAVPPGVSAVRLRTWWAADRPETAYTLSARITGATSHGGVEVTDTDTTTSGRLAGTAAGELRPARVSTSKVALSPGPVTVGEEVLWEVRVSSLEDHIPATALLVRDSLPPHLAFVAASDGGTHTDGVVTWPAADLPAGEVLVRTVRARVLESAADLTEVTNAADLTGRNVRCTETPDATASPAADGLSQCEAQASLPLARPGVTLDKTVLEVTDDSGDGVVGSAGDRVRYGFTVTSTGNTTLQSALLTDPLLGLVDHECLAAPLPPGEKVSCVGEHVHVVTEADVAAGSVVNIATIRSPGAPPSTDEVSTPTIPSPASPGPMTTPEPAAPAPPATPASPSADPTPTVSGSAASPAAAARPPLAETGADGAVVALAVAAGLLGVGGTVLALTRARRRRSA